MSSEARKLDPSAALPNQRATLLGGFNEVTAALFGEVAFAPYQAESPDAGIVSLNNQGITLVCLSADLWNSESRFKPFHDRLSSPEICIVCVGSEQELSHLPDQCQKSEVQTLSFPLSAMQLHMQIKNLFKMRAMLLAADTNRKSVEDAANWVKYILSVSREMNGVRDTNKLLSLILLKAREITSADAGSIYVVEKSNDNPREGTIHFKVTQNDSVYQDLTEFQIPINEGSIVGNAVIHETAINITDLYKLDPDPSKNPYGARHDRTWDQRLGYQARSMLTLPVFDISHNVVGVIQLINRKVDRHRKLKTPKDFDEVVIAFDDTTIEYAEIVAQQAGIALENALLTEEKEQLFQGFVHASVTAIEQRDPTTSGHSHRVAKLTVGMAVMINKTTSGPYSNLVFNENQLKEIEFASLLHDFGKLGVREQVLVKAKKLYPWQLDLLMERFELIRSRFEIEHQQELIKYLVSPNSYPPGFGPESFSRKKDERLNELDTYLKFILKANEPTVLEQGGFEMLKDIANKKFRNSRDHQCPFLHSEELKALSVSRGSLTREEFAEIQSHVVHTYEFLRKIPWGKNFANVPQIAAKHHEKLDGSGYPNAAQAQEIPVQSRMMTIADIFDALTASDRPYKKAVPTPKALEIIEVEVKSNRLDAELWRIFLESKVYESVLESQPPPS